MNLFKENMYIINDRMGQYELTTEDNRECFFMDDTDCYEYFKDAKIEHLYSLKNPALPCKKCQGPAQVSLYSEGVFVCGCRKNYCASVPICGSGSEREAVEEWNELNKE